MYRVHGDDVRASGTKGVRYAVSAFFEDCEQNLWIGADNLWLGSGAVGLLRLKDGKVTTFGAEEGLATDYAWSVLEDARGALWVGTSGGLSLARGDRTFAPVTAPASRGKPLTDPIIMALTPSRQGGSGSEPRGAASACSRPDATRASRICRGCPTTRSGRSTRRPEETSGSGPTGAVSLACGTASSRGSARPSASPRRW